MVILLNSTATIDLRAVSGIASGTLYVRRDGTVDDLRVSANSDMAGYTNLSPNTEESFAGAAYALGWGSLTVSSSAYVAPSVNTLGGSSLIVRSPERLPSVMTTPPALTDSTTNPLSTGQLIRSVNLLDTGVNYSSFSFFRGGKWAQRGLGSPDYKYLSAYNITQGSPSPFSNTYFQVSMIHTGQKIVIVTKGVGQKMIFKVDGEYVTLTPTSIAVDGAEHYTQLDFGSVGRRRIDLSASSLLFGGVFVEQTGAVEAAPKRGPTVVILGDSFTEGTGNEIGQLMGWPWYFAELMGWDDVISSGVGSTGLLAGTLPKVKYSDRAARDVGEVGATRLIVSQSINDSARTAAEVVAAAEVLMTTLTAAGWSGDVTFAAPTINKGVGWQTAAITQNKTMKAWALSKGYKYLDDIEIPIDTTIRHTTTLTTNATSGATSLVSAENLIPGATYEFADGTAFLVKSISATTSTIDNLSASQVAGAVITQRGGCYITGAGKVGATTGWGTADLAVAADGTHPSNLGHFMKGSTLARLNHAILSA